MLGCAGQQESPPQQAEVTIGLLPACFLGKVAQWHRCLGHNDPPKQQAHIVFCFMKSGVPQIPPVSFVMVKISHRDQTRQNITCSSTFG